MRQLDAKELQTYIENVVHNLNAPLNAYPNAVIEADDLLTHIVDCLNHPEDFFSSTKMFMFAHSAWRSAMVLSVAGGNAHVTPVLRQAIEAAMYGFLFRYDAAFSKLWTERETSATAKASFRNKWSKRTKELLKERNPQLQERIGKRVEDLIAFGGHPNFLSVEAGFEIEDLAHSDDYQASLSYLGDNNQRMLTMVQAAMVAEMIALLFAETFPNRARFMGFNQRLRKLAMATLSLIKEHQNAMKGSE